MGMEWDGMGWNGMEWDGMGWNGMEWDGMGWDGMGYLFLDRADVGMRDPFPAGGCLLPNA